MFNPYNCHRCLDTGMEAIPSLDDVDFEPCDCGAEIYSNSQDAVQALIERADSLASEPTTFEFAKKFSI